MTQDQANTLATFQQVKADISDLRKWTNAIPVNVKNQNVSGKGIIDDTYNLKLAVAANRDIFIPDGIYNVSAPIVVPDNTRIRFAQNAWIKVVADFPAFNFGGNDARYVFVNGNNCRIDDAKIDVGGFVAGGIATILRTDSVIHNCTVKNWSGVFGLCDIGASRVWYSQNTLKNGVHGIHSYKSYNVVASENNIDVMTGGGIYSAWTKAFNVVGNYVSNCADVGIDFEGGSYCCSYANTVERCKNGELALFSGNGEDTTIVHHLIHRGNTIHRKATYVVSYNTNGSENALPIDTTYGGCSIMSVANGSYEVGFDTNHITVDVSKGFFHSQLGDIIDKKVFFTNNTVVSKAGFFQCLNSVNLRFSGNKFFGQAGSETSENELRDAHALIFTSNEFSYDNPKTAGYTLLLNTSSAFATKAPIVANNTFANTAGYSIKVDLFNNGSLKPKLRNNSLGDTYTATGGVSVSVWGNVDLKDQKLKLLLAVGNTDFTNIDAINRIDVGKAVGTLGFGRSGYNGLLASVFIVKGTGNINTNSTIQCAAANLNVTTNNNSIITLANTTGTPTFSYLDLEVNSY